MWEVKVSAPPNQPVQLIVYDGARGVIVPAGSMTMAEHKELAEQVRDALNTAFYPPTPAEPAPQVNPGMPAADDKFD